MQVEASLHAKCLNPTRRDRRSRRLAEDWTQLLSAAQQADHAQQAPDSDPAAGLQELSIQPHAQPSAQVRPCMLQRNAAQHSAACCARASLQQPPQRQGREGRSGAQRLWQLYMPLRRKVSHEGLGCWGTVFQ